MKKQELKLVNKWRSDGQPENKIADQAREILRKYRRYFILSIIGILLPVMIGCSSFEEKPANRNDDPDLRTCLTWEEVERLVGHGVCKWEMTDVGRMGAQFYDQDGELVVIEICE